MNTTQTSLLALLAVMILTLSMSLIADQNDGQKTESDGLAQPDTLITQAESTNASASEAADSAPTGVSNTSEPLPANAELLTASSRKPPETPALTIGSDDAAEDSDKPQKEKVWSDISQAITSLNDMVGDDMFRELHRKSATTMEVRVDLDYWQRVRYETRVDLKNDISNIWHLYVRQYNDDNQSAVFFIDDRSGKTIDIFTQREKSEQ